MHYFVLRPELPWTHFEIPSEDFVLARKSRSRYRFVMHAEIWSATNGGLRDGGLRKSEDI